MTDKSKFEQWKENLGETRPWDMLNPQSEKVSIEIAEKRMGICNECPRLLRTNQCSLCGCFMHLKTKLSKAECPEGKWGKEV